MHFLCVAPLVKNCLQLVCSYTMCRDMILSYVNETHALFETTSSFFGSGGADATQTSHFWHDNHAYHNSNRNCSVVQTCCIKIF